MPRCVSIIGGVIGGCPHLGGSVNSGSTVLKKEHVYNS